MFTEELLARKSTNRKQSVKKQLNVCIQENMKDMKFKTKFFCKFKKRNYST